MVASVNGANGERITPEQTSAQVARVGIVKTTEPTLGKPARTQAWNRKVREMRRDPTISLVRRLVLAPALAASWSFEHNDNAPNEAVDLISEVFDGLRVHLIDTAFRGCIDFGWQGYEVVFDANKDGWLVITKMKQLLQDFTDILVDEKTGAYAGLAQDKLELDINNTFLHAWDVEGTDWYGEALMRNVEAPYDESNAIRDVAARYGEKIAGSHIVVKYPMGTSTINGTVKDNGEIAAELANAMRASGVITIPITIDPTAIQLGQDNKNAWSVELLTDSGAASTGFIESRKYQDTLKARGLGVPERAILEGQFGTKAESQEHGEFAVVLVEMRHNMLCIGLNWHLVNRILRLNFGPEYENTVWIKPSPLTDKQRTYYRDLYGQLISNPDVMLGESDDIDMTALRDKLDIPTKPKSESVTMPLPGMPGANPLEVLLPGLFPAANGA